VSFGFVLLLAGFAAWYLYAPDGSAGNFVSLAGLLFTAATFALELIGQFRSPAEPARTA
jgi:hypothetical protein